MLTGYNTDIRRGEIVAHVQTEDKGQDNPFVESLIFLGGRVVAAKRSSYAELLADGNGEAAVARLMDRQHRTIVAAIQRGRLDAMLQGVGGAAEEARGSGDDTPSGIHAVMPDIDLGLSPPPTGQPEIAAAGGLSLDLSSATPLALGDTVVIWVRASKDGESAAGVAIRIEMISTVQAEQLLAEGTTDAEGLYKIDLEIPELETGSAAVIVSGSSGQEFAEIKELL